MLWQTQTMLTVAFVAAGGSKLIGTIQMASVFDQIGVGQWFRYVTGFIGIAAGLGLLVLRTAPYAAGLLSITMLCAIGIHLYVIGGNPLPAGVLAALAGVVSLLCRRRI